MEREYEQGDEFVRCPSCGGQHGEVMRSKATPPVYWFHCRTCNWEMALNAQQLQEWREKDGQSKSS